MSSAQAGTLKTVGSATAMNAGPDLSIVIPALNERQSLRGLLGEIEEAMRPLDVDWEAIVVDDGSVDATAALIEELARGQSRIRGIRLRRRFGKSAALAAGFDHARGATMSNAPSTHSRRENGCRSRSSLPASIFE